MTGDLTTTPSAPPVPRAAERLLAALGADPDFRDVLLGDMAEEFALRAAYDGERAAARWYRREALRVAPHLLRDWARHLGWRGAARLAGVVLSAYALTRLITFPVGVAVARLVPGGAPNAVAAGPGGAAAWGPGVAVLLVALRLLIPAIGGWIAAALGRETPLPAAFAFGLANAAAGVALVGFVAPGAVPLWLQLAQALLVVAAAALGGALRVRSRRAPPAV